MSSFDRIAPYYDFLATLVFGKRIVKAQEYFLAEIKEGDCVLILGGGTGWILNSIFKVVNPGKVWYIDSAAKMIEKARSRKFDPAKVHFVQGTVEAISGDLKFDVVITNFFLDMFSDKNLPALIGSIKSKIKPHGIWVCTDFVDTGKFRHKMLVQGMYLFFKTVATMENHSLPDWEGSLVREGFKQFNNKSSWNGFIKSVVFKKIG